MNKYSLLNFEIDNDVCIMVECLIAYNNIFIYFLLAKHNDTFPILTLLSLLLQAKAYTPLSWFFYHPPHIETKTFPEAINGVA